MRRNGVKRLIGHWRQDLGEGWEEKEPCRLFALRVPLRFVRAYV